MPSKQEMVEELKTLGVEASIEEKASDLQKKLDIAKEPKSGEKPQEGETAGKVGGEKPPEEKPKKTIPVLKGGVYHKGKQYEAGTEVPKELEDTFRALDAVEDRIV